MPSKRSATQRGYTGDWSRASRAYRKENPLCVRCKAEGRLVAATQVDHIKPWRGDRNLFWDITNWQSLCASCHSLKTNHEDRGGRGNPGCDINGNPPGGWNETIPPKDQNTEDGRKGIRPFGPRRFPTYRASTPEGGGSNQRRADYRLQPTALATRSAADRQSISVEMFATIDGTTSAK